MNRKQLAEFLTKGERLSQRIARAFGPDVSLKELTALTVELGHDELSRRLGFDPETGAELPEGRSDASTTQETPAPESPGDA